jgi:methylase of polypeptide subunit release factors
MQEELVFKNGLKIQWERGLDGGGSTQYRDFLKLLENKKYDHGLEWCAGLGAIGFSLLDAGICERMSFTDIYEPSQTYIDTNAIKNNISNKVRSYITDAISKLPSDAKFDVVVGNPPHCYNTDGLFLSKTTARLVMDKDWLIHKEFFSNIIQYLNPNGEIFLSETGPHEVLIDYAQQCGLTYKGSYPAEELSKNSNIWACILHFAYEKEIY